MILTEKYKIYLYNLFIEIKLGVAIVIGGFLISVPLVAIAMSLMGALNFNPYAPLTFSQFIWLIVTLVLFDWFFYKNSDFPIDKWFRMWYSIK